MLSAALFEPHIDTTFRVVATWPPTENVAADEAGALDIPIVLKKVQTHDFAGPFDQFSLLFDGPSGQPFDQGSFVVTHDEVQVECLFLVPRSDDGQRRRYEAGISVPRQTERAEA